MSDQRLTVLAILCFALALRACALFVPHIENDEVIYHTLAEKLTQTPFEYTLRGTGILRQLPAAQYDHPMFRHPPVFLYLLALVYRTSGIAWGILLPIVSGTLCIYLGYRIAVRLVPQDALLAMAVMAGCPILLLTASRLWIDATSVFFMLAAFYCFIEGFESGRRIDLVFAGLALGLGLLSKYVTAGIIPAILLWAALKGQPIAPSLRKLALVFALAALCVTPWFIWYRHGMGDLSYTVHFAPTDEYLAMFPHVRRCMALPPHAYFTQLALACPVYLFALLTLRKKTRSRETLVLWCWTGSFFLGLMLFLHLQILGYSLRYLLPATIPLSILAARGIASARRYALPVAIPLLAYQLLTGILNSFIIYNADVFPLIRF